MTPADRKSALLLRRFATLFLLPNIAFAAVAAATNANALIAMLNGVTIALSIGVCVAFVPAMFAIFVQDRALDRSDYLAFGIWLTWLAAILQAGWSIVWRWRGMPMWMASTDFTSYFLFMRVCGAVCHLASPGAIDDRIPPRRWLLIGVLIAATIIVMMMVGWMLDLVALRDIGRLAG